MIPSQQVPTTNPNSKLQSQSQSQGGASTTKSHGVFLIRSQPSESSSRRSRRSNMDERWAGIGSTIASLIFIWTVVSNILPEHMDLALAKYARKLVAVVNPYVQIRFPELSQGWRTSSPAYLAIESYVASICTDSARRLMADMVKDSTRLSLKMDDKEEVADTHDGAKLWWCSTVVPIRAQTLMWSGDSDVRRYYTLTFHRRDRELIQDHYLPYVMERGKALQLSKRQRKLHTNSGSADCGGYKIWSHVPFEHPATFDTIAMEPEKKKEILEDLDMFRNGKDYYATIGKAWKRGYLLHGPPGTGKSSLVAAMANLLDYDVYDIELTAVKDNTSLRRLLIETASKSIIVIEDIDCSLDLTGQRKKPPPKKKGSSDELEEKISDPAVPPEEDEPKDSKVTLSGLLNFIDGLWSACGSERLIVFTTNYIEKLDPALIRRGRMDKHIELSYCGFQSFKVLAKNYLRVSDHSLFQKVRDMMAEVNITPADVAENLMPKRKYRTEEDKVRSCLEDLIKAMVEAKAKAEDDLEEAKAAAETEKKGQEENDKRADEAERKSSAEKEDV